MPGRPAGCIVDLPCELFPLPAYWLMWMRIIRYVVCFRAGYGTNVREYTTGPVGLPQTPVFIAAHELLRNQRSPGRVGSASSSSSGSSRASSSGRRLRVMRYCLGPAYYFYGASPRPIPVATQKGV